eukprot:CAMPEP_0181122174 /NCGR_PEP_ID=MMETSP1071-20121207/25161_1 /TAXON_ID=35127 /ORGANISM="Thalassiosira sp., Strain NH16" /LENGTH=458 /DNA_ID=CAMNT_0023207103 /DNA_START=258 /DNA_END=1635 /DNA_ORIENTATION=-
MPPTIKDIHNARAPKAWNILCCPLVSTIGNLWRSIVIYLLPCIRALSFRCVHAVWGKLCCCLSWPYEDDAFFGAGALGNHESHGEKTSAKQMDKETDWIRAHDLETFKGRRPQLFEGKIEPDDLCQGAVGDCWLVAAFACASEFPDAVRRMFVTQEYNPRGLYKVRIFDPVKKKFVVVTVDDRIPCKKGTRRPRFMSPNGNELWAIILEKAYAKFCGSYAALDGGFVLWGWHSFTGDNVFQMSKKKDKKKKDKKKGMKECWEREDMVAVDDKNDKRACGFRKTKEKYSDEQLWTLLKKYDRQKALMSASIGKMDYRKTDGPSGEQMLKREGLVAGHAYSVIQAREVSDGMMAGTGPAFKLLQLRNPWGTFEWKGAWSDKSKEWDKHPGIKKKVKQVDADDGTFWMTFEDFAKVYTRVNVCDRTTTNDASLDVNEDDGACGIEKVSAAGVPSSGFAVTA